MAGDSDDVLQQATLAALDGLLDAFVLKPQGDDSLRNGQ